MVTEPLLQMVSAAFWAWIVAGSANRAQLVKSVTSRVMLFLDGRHCASRARGSGWFAKYRVRSGGAPAGEGCAQGLKLNELVVRPGYSREGVDFAVCPRCVAASAGLVLAAPYIDELGGCVKYTR